MNEKEITKQHDYINQLIKEKRLKEALTQLDSFLYSSSDYELRMQLEQISTSYQYMLNYMKDGINDPERIKLYFKLLARTTTISDQAQLLMLDESSTKLYHSMRRKQAATSSPYQLGNIISRLEAFQDDFSIGSLFSKEKKEEILKDYEEMLRQLFMNVWTNSMWSTEEQAQAQLLLTSPHIPENAKSLFCSAVTLSLFSCFDIYKLKWFIEAYTSDNTLVAQRALVGLVFIIHIYTERLLLYPELPTLLEMAAEKKPLASDLIRIYKQILMAQETEKIDKKMREEIIPEMIKNVPNMHFNRFDQDDADDERNDGNPDWEHLIDQTGIGDKLREMNDLQMEGADVQMSTFAGLKGFAFFREIHHWFYLFDRLQPDVYRILEKEESENKMFNMILETGIFCNSDKYSLLFIMQQLPASQRNAVFSQLTEQQMESFMDSSEAQNFKKLSEQTHVVSNQYLQDLYRFFKLSYYRTDFVNLFKEKFDLHKLPLLKEYLNNESTLTELLNFFIKKERWTQAIEVCNEIVALNGSKVYEAEFYQKLGYALQKNGEIDNALQAYLKADTISPDNQWSNRHIANCYRLKRDFAKAIEWYNKVLESSPENSRSIYLIGSCYAELSQYEEALKYFFKLDYLENSSIKALRGITWCSFVLGKNEQAMKYCRKVMEKNPNATDFLNAGHIACCTRAFSEAASYYHKAAEMLKSKDHFLELFYKDKDYLLAQGISADELPLIADLV